MGSTLAVGAADAGHATQLGDDVVTPKDRRRRQLSPAPLVVLAPPLQDAFISRMDQVDGAEVAFRSRRSLWDRCPPP